MPKRSRRCFAHGRQSRPSESKHPTLPAGGQCAHGKYTAPTTYGRRGKCLGLIRTPPSHPHIAFAQRKRFTTHSTLTTRSSAVRGIRRAVLPQSGHTTGSLVPAVPYSRLGRDSPSAINPPRHITHERAPDLLKLRSVATVGRRRHSPTCRVGLAGSPVGYAAIDREDPAVHVLVTGRPDVVRTGGLAIARAPVRQMSVITASTHLDGCFPETETTPAGRKQPHPLREFCGHQSCSRTARRNRPSVRNGGKQRRIRKDGDAKRHHADAGDIRDRAPVLPVLFD